MVGLLHQPASLLEKIASPARRFCLVADSVCQGHFSHFAGTVRALGAPVSEAETIGRTEFRWNPVFIRVTGGLAGRCETSSNVALAETVRFELTEELPPRQFSRLQP